MTPSATGLYHEVSSDVGTALPVLLLRPIAGTIALWGALRTALELHRRVIVCEARGIGRSPAAVMPTSTRNMARDVAALLDALQIRTAHVFGLSLGGMVATWLAIDRPDLVRGVVLASTPARGLDLVRATGDSVGFASCLARRSGAREACLTERALSPRFRREHPERTAAILGAVCDERGSLRSLLLHGAAGALHAPGSALQRIAAPTLCIGGALDSLVSPASLRGLASAIPGAKLELIDNAGHDLSLEQPLELARRVERFLVRHDPR